MPKSKTMLNTATKPMTAAAMARPVSRPLTLLPGTAAAGRGDGAPEVVGRGAGIPVEVGGRDTVGAGIAAAGLPPEVGGLGATGAPDAATPAAGATAEAGAPEAGGEGSRIVGVVIGLGGRLMRTVSFLG